MNEIISFQDVNDNAPRYLDPSPYKFHVKESVKGKCLILTHFIY